MNNYLFCNAVGGSIFAITWLLSGAPVWTARMLVAGVFQAVVWALVFRYVGLP